MSATPEDPRATPAGLTAADCAVRLAGLLEELPIGKLRQLGGKFGDEVQQALGITTVGAYRCHSHTLLQYGALARCLGDAVSGRPLLLALCRGAGPDAALPTGCSRRGGEGQSSDLCTGCSGSHHLQSVVWEPGACTCARHGCGCNVAWHVQAGWLARLARGLDDEAVKPRLLPKSVGCSKTFRGRSALTTLKLVHDWLLSIGAPLCQWDSTTAEQSRVAVCTQTLETPLA